MIAIENPILNRPFSNPDRHWALSDDEVPPGGKIAVKVINHYGDGVMKVYDVAKVEGCR